MNVKKFCCLILIFIISSGISYAAQTNNNTYTLDEDNDGTETVSNQEYSYNYQLRSVAGSARDEYIAGNQWFATVHENYLSYQRGSGTNKVAYRRTTGGEMPAIHVDAETNLLSNFNYILLNEAQPYTTGNLYDEYPDPLETLCFVISEGRGDFYIDLKNSYSWHYPFWWEYTNTNDNVVSIATSSVLYTIPISRSNKNIYSGYGTDGEVIYTISGDKTSTQFEILDSGELIYKVSGDRSSGEIYDSSSKLIYTMEDDIIYNTDEEEIYTIEDMNNNNYVCIVPVKAVKERIKFSDEEENYIISVTPSEGTVMPTESLTSHIQLNASDVSDYSSKLAYINFSQAANLATGYSAYAEAALIPVVIANVSNGNASENPLKFDMIIYENNTSTTSTRNNNNNNNNTRTIKDRVKFEWDAQSDKTQSIGNIFLIQSSTGTNSNPTYNLETRITNNTGTRYRMQRYDTINTASDITPDHWEYNITDDPRNYLPDTFHLDPHSQIAPGLITVYGEDVDFNTINTETDTSESFALYEFSSASPKKLTLSYKIIQGFTTAQTDSVPSNYQNASALGLSMKFMNVVENENNTVYQIKNIIGKSPALTSSGTIPSNSTAVSLTGEEVTTEQIGSEKYYAFKINKVTPGTATKSDFNVTASTDITSEDQTVELQPVQIKFNIPRSNSLISSHWENFETAESSKNLLNEFMKYAAVWVRSDATNEKDANLFSALSDKADLSQCFKIYINDDDNLTIEFIAVLADAVTPTTNKTAFIKTFTDDGIPYILIGDGAEDGYWNLTFFIAANGASPYTSDINNNSDSSANNTSAISSGSSGGGGCNLNLYLGSLLILAIFIIRRRII